MSDSQGFLWPSSTNQQQLSTRISLRSSDPPWNYSKPSTGREYHRTRWWSSSPTASARRPAGRAAPGRVPCGPVDRSCSAPAEVTATTYHRTVHRITSEFQQKQTVDYRSVGQRIADGTPNGLLDLLPASTDDDHSAFLPASSDLPILSTSVSPPRYSPGRPAVKVLWPVRDRLPASFSR